MSKPPDTSSGRERKSNSFVLRIWWEKGSAHQVWRAWVQHAASGENHYFDRLADLLAFVETHTGSLAHVPLPETIEPEREHDQ